MTVSRLEFDFTEPSGIGYPIDWYFQPTNVLTVTNDLIIQRTSPTGQITLNRGRINLYGNLEANAGASGGSTHVYFQSNIAQTLSGLQGWRAPIIHINKPAGAVTVPSTDSGCEGLLIEQGNFTAPTGLFTIHNNSSIAQGGTIFSTSALGNFFHNTGSVKLFTQSQYLVTTAHTIDVNTSVTFNNLEFKFLDPTWYSMTYTIGAGDTINVLGNLSLGRLGTVETVSYNGGTINVSGNYDVGAGTNGGTTIILDFAFEIIT